MKQIKTNDAVILSACSSTRRIRVLFVRQLCEMIAEKTEYGLIGVIICSQTTLGSRTDFFVLASRRSVNGHIPENLLSSTDQQCSMLLVAASRSSGRLVSGDVCVCGVSSSALLLLYK